MAELITRDSFVDTANRKVFVQFAGTPVVDSDLTEASKIPMVELAENAASANSPVRAAANNDLRYGVAEGGQWQAFASNTADLFIKAGTLFVDGMRLTLASDLSLVAQGFTFGTVGGATVYGLVVVDLVLTQVDGSSDASLLIPNVGSVSERYVLTPTFTQIESTVSFFAAFLALTAVPDPVGTSGAVWNGDVARIVLARYARPPATTTMLTSYVVDLRAVSAGEAFAQQKLLKTIRATDTLGSGASDGMLAWTASSGVLTVGKDNGLSNIHSLERGLVLDQPGAPQHFASNTGTTWTIADGSALGYSTVFSASVTTALLTKKNAGNAAVYDYGANVPGSYTPAQLTVEQLCVQSLDGFITNADRGNFVVCHRVGPDLVWFNGHVTRGDATLAVVDDFGGTPSPYTAVVSAAGQGTQNHATQTDAVDRVLNAITLSSAASPNAGYGGTFANGRTVRVYVRAGNYVGIAGIKKYGFADTAQTAAYASTNSSVELVGDGDTCTQITFANPVSSGRTDTGVCNIQASRIVLRGITFSQTESSSHPAAYLLNLQAYEVVLEDCTFNGAVSINADVVRVKHCTFNAGQTGSYLVFGAAGDSVPYASALYFHEQNVGMWTLDDCLFNLNAVGGTTSAVVVTLNNATQKCRISNCEFVYGIVAPSYAPSIHIAGGTVTTGSLLVENCKFIGANGKVKAGVKLSALSYPFTDTSPYTGSYAGAPLIDTVNQFQLAATAYISCVGGRNRNSTTRIKDCYFDMGAVGAQTTGHLIMWGAVMFLQNTVTAGTTPVVANVYIENNVVYLYQDSGSGWTAAAADPQPLIWGFYFAPLLQDGALTSLQYDNIKVTGNKFDLGGQSSSGGVPAKTWRSMTAPDLNLLINNSVTQTVFETTDGSCLIGVVIRNVSYGAAGSPNNYIGRYATGVEVCGNAMACRPSASTINYGQITLDLTVYPRYSFWPIVLSNTDPWLQMQNSIGYSLVGGSAPFYISNSGTGGSFVGPVVADNSMDAAFYVASVATPTAPYTGYPFAGVGIGLSGTYGARLHNNYIYMSLNAGGSVSFTAGIDTNRCRVTTSSSNQVKADVGISVTQLDEVSVGNHCVGCTRDYLSGTITWPVTGGLNVPSNFTLA